VRLQAATAWSKLTSSTESVEPAAAMPTPNSIASDATIEGVLGMGRLPSATPCTATVTMSGYM